MVTSPQAFNSLGLELKPSPSSLLPPVKLQWEASSLLFLPYHLRVWYDKRESHRGSWHQDCAYQAKEPAPHSHPDQVPIKLRRARSKARDTHPSQPNGGLWQPTITTKTIRTSPDNEGKIHLWTYVQLPVPVPLHSSKRTCPLASKYHTLVSTFISQFSPIRLIHSHWSFCLTRSSTSELLETTLHARWRLLLSS